MRGKILIFKLFWAVEDIRYYLYLYVSFECHSNNFHQYTYRENGKNMIYSIMNEMLSQIGFYFATTPFPH